MAARDAIEIDFLLKEIGGGFPGSAVAMKEETLESALVGSNRKGVAKSGGGD